MKEENEIILRTTEEGLILDLCVQLISLDYKRGMALFVKKDEAKYQSLDSEFKEVLGQLKDLIGEKK